MAQHACGVTIAISLAYKLRVDPVSPVIQKPPITCEVKHRPIQLIHVLKVIEPKPNRRKLVVHAIGVGCQILDGHLADKHCKD